jgi:thiol-disulfide isomerase/thioredoxin
MNYTLFDPQQSPYDATRDALEQAKREKKNVLLELGGDWCVWCQRLEAFIQAHPELLQLREQHYVLVRIQVGNEQPINLDFLEQLPPFDAVPHFFVYNARGQLLHSQPTNVLEEGESYNYEMVRSFLSYWSDPKLSPYDVFSTEELKRRFEEGFGSSDDGPALTA